MSSDSSVDAEVCRILRHDEIESVKRWFGPGLRVLELGGADGYQASLLSSMGSDVLSIDINDRPRPGQCFHPVVEYDGRNIPAPDASFDVVFTSNVLEHVRALGPLLEETGRVMKPNGTAVHIVPSAAWRFWTCATFPGHALRLLANRWRSAPCAPADGDKPGPAASPAGPARWIRAAIAAHGEYPNALAELYYFSRRRWRDVFRRAEFEVVHAGGNGIFYTGHLLFPGLPLGARRCLARLLGSACHIFVLKRALPSGPS